MRVNVTLINLYRCIKTCSVFAGGKNFDTVLSRLHTAKGQDSLTGGEQCCFKYVDEKCTALVNKGRMAYYDKNYLK